jgi:FSR family fosmidomycin resistance protein-like MFS transporter
MLALYELAGVGGALGGGTLSDRFGRKRTMIIAIVLSAIFAYIFFNIEGFLVYPVLILLGLTTLSVAPIIQALVQEQFPNNRATASGMFILYAFLVRAVNTLAIGMLGDTYGLQNTFVIIIVLSLISIPIVLALPDSPEEKVA